MTLLVCLTPGSSLHYHRENLQKKSRIIFYNYFIFDLLLASIFTLTTVYAQNDNRTDALPPSNKTVEKLNGIKCQEGLSKITLKEVFFSNDDAEALDYTVKSFMQMDYNSDGIIDRSEVKKFGVNQGSISTQDNQTRIRFGDFYDFADTKKDYKVTKDEFVSTVNKMMSSKFTYCKSWCDQVADKLNICGFFQNSAYQRFYQLAAYSLQVCKLGSSNSKSTEKCIMKNSCDKIDSCFLDYFYYSPLGYQQSYKRFGYRQEVNVALIENSNGTIDTSSQRVQSNIRGKMAGMIILSTGLGILAAASFFLLFFAIAFDAFFLAFGAFLLFGTFLAGMIVTGIFTQYIARRNVIFITGPQKQSVVVGGYHGNYYYNQYNK